MTDMATLNRVNQEVNAIPYVGIVGAGEPYDWWGDSPHAGWSWECRCYAERKATLLRDDGWPAETLLTFLCYTELGEYHAVLAVSGDDGVMWVLDNRWPQVYREDQPPYPYRWVWKQIAGSTEFLDVSAA